MSKKIELTVTVDTNDGDYDSEVTKITQEELDEIMPLIKAIKNFKSYKSKAKEMDWEHHHNYPYGEMLREDLGEKSPEEIYSNIDPDIHQLFIEEYCPLGNEYGFHTIKSITTSPLVERKELL